MTERDPTQEELDQVEEETKGASVPVAVQGPVRVQRPPSPLGSMRSFTVNDTEPKRIANRDLRRRRTVIYSADQPFYVGVSQNEVEAGTAALWRDHEPLVLEHCEEIWVICSATGQTTIISIIGELWTE